jgi:DNA-binding transcriptional LysR family regulator
LLDEGRRLLDQMDAVANRVKRVATGWETQLTVVVDDICSRSTILELCADFYGSAATTAGSAEASTEAAPPSAPPTRLRIRNEVLAGTWEALVTGQADLAIGVGSDGELPKGVAMKELGPIEFVFAVAPHHPLARCTTPIDDAELIRHRAVAVADSASRLTPITVNLLPGQDVLTVSDMQAKIAAQLGGLGCGFVPEPMVRDFVAAGRLVVREVARTRQPGRLGYAWRVPPGRSGGEAQPGLALRWWLDRLAHAETRRALLDRYGSRGGVDA